MDNELARWPHSKRCGQWFDLTTLSVFSSEMKLCLFLLVIILSCIAAYKCITFCGLEHLGKFLQTV